MNKQTAIELKTSAENVAERFSNSNRDMNFNNEKFMTERIIPTSDHTATVIFRKSSGKQGVAFFYYIANGMSKGWKYFFPTDSHITGMRAFEFHKLMAEDDNFKHNFKNTKDNESNTNQTLFL